MKKIITLALCLASVSALSACNKKTTLIEVIDEFSGKDITIEFWHVSNDVDGVSPFQTYADSFMEEYSNVTVELVYNDGSYAGLDEDIRYSIVTDEMPNIAIGYNTNFIDYNQSLVIAQLDNFISHEKWGLTEEEIADYTDTGFWYDGTSYDEEGTTYSMPLSKGTEAMYVRGDLVKAAGYSVEELTTWEKVFEVSKKLEEMDEPFVINYDDPQNFAVTLFGQASAPFTTVSGDIQYIDSSLNAKSKQVITDVVFDNKDYIFNRNANQYPYGSNLLISNDVWMSIGSTTCRTWYDTVTELEILPIPQYSTNEDEAYAVLQGPDMALFISENSEENLASWLFMKHLTTPENSTDYAMKTGYVPVRLSAQNSEEFQTFLDLANDPTSSSYNIARACNVILAQRSALEGIPAFLGANDSRNEAGNIIANILVSDYTVNDAFNKAKENLYLYL